MKRFFSQAATEERNQTLNGSLASVTHAEVLVQRPLSPSARLIPIIFLGASEEQSVLIQPGVIEISLESFQEKETATGQLRFSRVRLK